MSKPLWPHQERGLTASWNAINSGVNRLCFTSPTGGGKCFASHVPILMHDGSTKRAANIRTGDRLMGPDSRPRVVVSTTQGRERMYRITPLRGGDPFVVNESHILSLRMTKGAVKSLSWSCSEYLPGNVVNISVGEYLCRSKTFKHCAKAYRVGVEFPKVEVPVDPYFLGVWLGDGSSRDVAVTTADSEIEDYLSDVASSYGLSLVRRLKAGNAAATVSISGVAGVKESNPLKAQLRELGVINNKHVPHLYKANSREVRLGVLAGLIDTDGSLHRAGCYDVVFKSETLARDTAFIARSLGFSSFVRACEKECVNNGKWGVYWRVSVYGDVDQIPVRIARKVSPPRTQKKDHLCTGFSVEPMGIGDYFGFEVSGPDRLFLLGDFTVTHNSRCMEEFIWEARKRDWKITLYTNRRLLMEQMMRVLGKAGIHYGIRAAGFQKVDMYNVQLASIQTEYSRVYRNKTWAPHTPNLVLVDEAHANSAAVCEQILGDHVSSGAKLVGFTATPTDLAHLYDKLIVAGVNSELRRCGAHLPCHTYAPDQPDAKLLPKVKVGETITEQMAKKAIMVPQIFGRVMKHWRIYNPEMRPTILFAPDVASSIWFAEEFAAVGIPAAHIDGNHISYGERDAEGSSVLYNSTKEERGKVLGMSESGEIKVLTNRFVLREGIDATWIYHCIMATVFGGPTPYLQSGGRLLRSHPSLDHVVLQDHGGNYWRYGSLNEDREWDLTWSDYQIASSRADQMREKKEPEPIVCPQCFKVRAGGPRCPQCGFEATKKSRMVVQKDGTLREVDGDILKPRRRAAQTPAMEAAWLKMYHRGRSKKWDASFAQIEAKFAEENYWQYPPRTLPLMPIDPLDWYKKVRDVPRERLIPVPNHYGE